MPFSGDQYRQLLDTAPDAIVVVNLDSCIVLVNRQAETLFGYTREELVGHQLELLIPSAHRGAHAAHVARYFARPTLRAMGSGLELNGRRKDGTELPIEVSLSPVQNDSGSFVAAAIRDISERRRMQQAFRQSAERLASAVESIDHAFTLFDADDRLCICNNVYSALVAPVSTKLLLGLSFAEIIELEMGLLTSGASEEFRRLRQIERERAQASYEMTTRAGRSYRVESRRTPEGGLVRMLVDISEEVARTEELLRARREAEAGSAAKSEFLASMSHELRTPLNAILGFAQLARRDKKEPLQSRHRVRIDQILKGGEHLLRLIDDILDLARIEAGGITISSERVELGPVIAQAVAALEPSAARAHVALHSSFADTPAVRADPIRVMQIVMNLGTNAIKYNNVGGAVEIRIEAVTAHAVRILVRDDGIGVPLDKRSSLFQPFQRAGQEMGPIEGTGIGLVISKRLAESMGGEVGYAARDDVRGSEFWVDLPVDVSLPESSHSIAVRGAGARRASGTVLYVEDNADNVAFLRDLLEGFESSIDLLVAPDAERGLELAREHLPCAIVMDINLPGMDGLEALDVLRSDPRTRAIPVIALTAAASEHDRERGERAGFFRYLTKPVQVDVLEDALEALLGKSPVESAGSNE